MPRRPRTSRVEHAREDYVTAMKQTMILPVVLLGIGALSCLALKGGNGKTAPQTAPEAVEEAPTRA